MKTTLKISIFAVLFLFGASARAQNAGFADTIKQIINNHLAAGNCDKAKTSYNIWKGYTSKTSSDIERRISECKNGKPPAPQGNTASSGSRSSTTIDMVYVRGGTFTMGCTPEQGDDCWDNEKPAHQVTLSSYYIGKYEVTQAQWKAVMGTNIRQQRDKADKSWPIYGEGDNYPMYYVSWEEVQEFIRKLNVQTGKTYRLPTEAEWEYAARGGNQSQGYKYSGSNTLGNIAWSAYNSDNKTHAVGMKQANELGIYDMSGNVWEWCSDWYGDYSSSSQTNPTGASSGSYRVARGGSWFINAQHCRVAYRYGNSPDFRPFNLGLRLACSTNP